MNYRPWLEGETLSQMAGLPDDALDTLTQTLGRICEEPYNRLFSRAVSDDPSDRMAEFEDDTGFIEFTVDEAAGLIRIYSLVWVG